MWRLYYNVVKSGAKWFFVVENYRKGVKVAEGGDSGMFLGQYQHSIDAKGRLIVPAKFREGLGERFVVTKGLDNCLFAYPQEEWKIFEEKLKQLPLVRVNLCVFSLQARWNVSWIIREELWCRRI